MIYRAHPLEAGAVVLVPLFRALDDAEAALRLAHPRLPEGDLPQPVAREDLLASVVLNLLDNLRAAAHAYHRERHLTIVSPQL
jgi:hypothetical protein